MVRGDQLHKRLSALLRVCSPLTTILLALAALVAVPLLAGCSPPAHSLPPLPDLEIPGATKIPGIEQLQQRTGMHSITAMATYVSAADHQVHVLFETHPATAYDARLDGSDLQAVQTACLDLASVSADQHWLACTGEDGILVLDLTRITAQGAQRVNPEQVAIPNAGDARLSSPTWAPDSQHLAAVTEVSGACAIVVYAASAGDNIPTLTVTTVLSLHEFQVPTPGGPSCTISELAWSPDNSWLSFLGNGSVWALPLAQVPVPVLGEAGAPAPVTVAVAHRLLVPVGGVADTSRPVWSPRPNVLTYVQATDRSIAAVNILTQRRRVLLSQDEALLFALSWTPDGRHLVFVLGRSQIPEAKPPPAQLYVYTPPDASFLP